MEQLSLFDLFASKKTETNPKSSPPSVSESVIPVIMSKPDWQKVMAIPVIVLAQFWNAFAGNGGSPCRKCPNANSCLGRHRCLSLAAFNAGMESKFGDSEGCETTTGFAEKGGTYGI